MNTNKNDKGFTLVELLIVIVILGILATVTVFAVRGITDRGEANACATEFRSVETAIEAYYAQNGQNDIGAAGDLVPDYLKEDPKYVTVSVDATTGDVSVAANDTANCGSKSTPAT